jgi:mycothiol system anti-sigma-R factor
MGDAEAHCREVIEHLFVYIDGEMDAREFAAIRRHLSLCVECLQQVDFEVEIKRIVRSKCSQEEVPEHVVARVRALIRDAGGSI